jgi:hypothetical protein
LEDVHGIGCRRIFLRECVGCEERFLVKKFQGGRKNEKRRMDEEDEEGNGEYGRGKKGSESSE